MNKRGRTGQAPSRFHLQPSDRDELRERYRPQSIAVLFIGESPPRGPRFFYKTNSRLFSAFQSAFELTYAVTFPSGESFLRAFQVSGCFLDDLCTTPVNHLPRGARRQARRDAESNLGRRVVAAQPGAVVPVMRLIERHVQQAVQNTGLKLELLPATPFPAFGHQQEAVRCLADHIRHLRSEGLLPSVLP